MNGGGSAIRTPQPGDALEPRLLQFDVLRERSARTVPQKRLYSAFVERAHRQIWQFARGSPNLADKNGIPAPRTIQSHSRGRCRGNCNFISCFGPGTSNSSRSIHRARRSLSKSESFRRNSDFLRQRFWSHAGRVVTLVLDNRGAETEHGLFLPGFRFSLASKGRRDRSKEFRV